MMCKNKNIMHLKRYLLCNIKITTINIFLGVLIVSICRLILTEQDFLKLDAKTIPSSAYNIFQHNAKISFIYMIPYVGIIYYIWAFFITYITIGVYMTTYGVAATLVHLWHLPLEVFALSMPIYVGLRYKRLSWQEIIYITIFSLFLLFVCSYIEYFLSKGGIG